MVVLGVEMTREEMRAKLVEMAEQIRRFIADQRDQLRTLGLDTPEKMADLDHQLAEIEAMRDIMSRVEAGGLGREERATIYARLLSMTQMNQLRALPTSTQMN